MNSEPKKVVFASLVSNDQKGGSKLSQPFVLTLISVPVPPQSACGRLHLAKHTCALLNYVASTEIKFRCNL